MPTTIELIRSDLERALHNALLFIAKSDPVWVFTAARFEYDHRRCLLEIRASDRHRYSIETIGAALADGADLEDVEPFVLERRDVRALFTATKRSDAGFASLTINGMHLTTDDEFLCAPLHQPSPGFPIMTFPDPASARPLTQITINQGYLADLGKVRCDDSGYGVRFYMSAPKPQEGAVPPLGTNHLPDVAQPIIAHYVRGPRVLTMPISDDPGRGRPE